MKKSLLPGITFLSGLIGLALLVFIQWPDQLTRVIFCDVGQGDATLITQGSVQILIDGGKGSKVMSCLEEHLPFWDRQIELVIATHADNDHIGGLPAVLKHYFVKQMNVTQFGSKTGAFWSLREAVLREQEQGMELGVVKTNTTGSLSPNLHFYNFVTRVEGFDSNPFLDQITEAQLWDRVNLDAGVMKEWGLSLNTLSIATLLEVGKIKFLLMGDLDLAGEQALLDRGLIADVDVLKAGHHGSKTSTVELFLGAAQPEIVAISVGKNNSYGHPNPQVMAKITATGAKIYRTDEKGTIIIATDGKSYWLEE